MHAETSASLGKTSCGVSVCHRNSSRLKKWSFPCRFRSDFDVMRELTVRAVGQQVKNAKTAVRVERIECLFTSPYTCRVTEYRNLVTDAAKTSSQIQSSFEDVTLHLQHGTCSSFQTLASSCALLSSFPPSNGQCHVQPIHLR